jgi:Transcription elongation factor
MNLKPISISQADHTRITLLLNSLRGDPKAAKIIARLREELERALVLPELPPHIVGINSTAEVLDLDSGEVDRFTLTLPEQANAAQGRLSLLAPLGTAILGFSEGDEFEWEMPGGVRRLRINKVVPPVPVAVPQL